MRSVDHYWISVPTMNIRSSSICMYNRVHSTMGNRPVPASQSSLLGKEKRVYSGDVTKGSKGRIKKAIELLVMKSKPQLIYNPIIKKSVTHTLSFITLTIPNQDNYYTGIYMYNTMLKPYLQWLTKTINIKSYVWKVERQKYMSEDGKVKSSLGQLHYHIITEAFIKHDVVRNKWNYLLSKNQLMDSYKREYGNSNPNSTDIHAIYKVKDVASYLIKYVSKDCTDSNSKLSPSVNYGLTVEGKVWDCSNDLKGKLLPTFEVQENNYFMLENSVLNGNTKKIVLEHCTVYCISGIKPWQILTPSQLVDYNINTS